MKQFPPFGVVSLIFFITHSSKQIRNRKGWEKSPCLLFHSAYFHVFKENEWETKKSCLLCVTRAGLLLITDNQCLKKVHYIRFLCYDNLFCRTKMSFRNKLFVMKCFQKMRWSSVPVHTLHWNYRIHIRKVEIRKKCSWNRYMYWLVLFKISWHLEICDELYCNSLFHNVIKNIIG